MSTWYFGADELANVAAVAVEKYRLAGVSRETLELTIRQVAGLLASYSAMNRMAFRDAYPTADLTTVRPVTAESLFERAADMSCCGLADTDRAVTTCRLLAYNLDAYRGPAIEAALGCVFEQIPGARPIAECA